MLEGLTDRLPVEGAWSADGGAFVAATLDNRLQVWTLPREAGTSATRSAQRPKAAGEGTAPLFGPDGRVWALTVDGMAFGPAEAAGTARRRFVSAGPEWLVARFSPDGKRVAIGAADGSALVFAVADAKLLQRIAYAAPPEVTPWAENLLWAPDGSWLAIGRLDGSSSLARFNQ